jgi:hypothetical protein
MLPTFGWSIAPYTVLARVQELYLAIRVMAPERDWAWLRWIEARVRHGAVLVRDKRLVLCRRRHYLATAWS